MNFAAIQHISAPFHFSFCIAEGIIFSKINVVEKQITISLEKNEPN